MLSIRRVPLVSLFALASLAVLSPWSSLDEHRGASVAQAAEKTPGAARRTDFAGATRIDPLFDLLFEYRARTGRTFPLFRPNRAFEATGQTPVVIRIDSGADDAALRERLARRGVQFGFDGTKVTSGAYVATVDAAGLDALAREPAVLRVSADMPRLSPPPLAESALETRIAEARRALRTKSGELLDGKGTVVGDMDSGFFIFHPAFFRADAGTFAFVDVNGDGQLTPEVDGVDLDGNGTIEKKEVLRRIATGATDRYDDSVIVDPGSTFRPDLDFLYLDENGNGARDYGKGFTEETPAYGEPLFVFDDANKNGKLEGSERLLRLGTSKFKAVLADRTYTRGGAGKAGLINYQATDPATLEYASHGTGVAGILVGGVPDVSRWLGLAPGADIVGFDDVQMRAQRGMIEGLEFAVRQGANVLLTEYAPYTAFPLDGSTEEETFLDASLGKGVVGVSPAGNLAAGNKHLTMRLEPGANVVPLRTDPSFKGAYFIQFTILHRVAGRHVKAELTMPNGVVVDVPTEAFAPKLIGNKLALYGDIMQSSRGTSMVYFALGPDTNTITPLPEGDYKLTLTPDAGGALPVELFAADNVNSWSRGLMFTGNTAAGTICHPSTSDKTLSVAAYVLHDEPQFHPWASKGELAGYSSMGPRIDGDTGIDIAAPDNPLSTALPISGNPSQYTPFGGTSGAGPHVAASALLLRQLFPAEPGDRLRARIVDNARKAGEATQWGAGKLDFAKAAGLSAPAGQVPLVTLTAPATAPAGTFVAKVTATDDEPVTGLRARWDFDYDGKPDTEWIALGEQAIPAPEPQQRAVRVEVLDTQGNVGAATALLTIGAAEPAAPVAPAPAASDDGCGCATPGASRTLWPLGGVLGLGLLMVARRRLRSRSR